MTAREPSIVRSSLLRFLLLSLVTLTVLGLGIVVESERIAHGEAIRDACVRSQRMAAGIVAPLVGPELRRRDRDVVRKLTVAMRHRMRDGSVAHVNVWDRDGRILWSDDPRLQGRRFELSPEVVALFASRGTVVRGTSPEQSENAAVAGHGLIEVYVGHLGADRQPFAFEAYFSPDRVDADADAIFAELLPLGLGALLLFQLAVLPLAWSLARRVDRGRRQRSDILSRSMAAWHSERRRLAHDLHDGVIADLSSAGYALPMLLDHLRDDEGAREARRVGEQLSAMLQHDLSALRSLVTDLFPADLTRAGLPTAIEELARLSAHSGVAVEVEVAPDLEIGQEMSGVVYRVVREGLRNVARHSGGRSAEVVVHCRGGFVDVVVSDDGRGPGHNESRDGNHVGLRLLSGLVSDVGGTLTLRAGEPHGSVLEARLPAVLVP